tara:strand:+ start:272 stop:472 length:201 start_codon:yes stop_codon:yes gene_type:complete
MKDLYKFAKIRKDEFDLHNQAIELMIKLDEKYKMDNTLSLDEYLYEYVNSLNKREVNKITNLINKF